MAASWRPELHVAEIPAPQRIAPFSVAVEADVQVAALEVGSGRLILLHDPDGNPAWGGEFRCVTYAKSEVPPEMGTDTLLGEVGWSWLLDALDERGAAYTAAAGTVTTVASQSFGDIEEDASRFEVEIRASWTPLLGAGGDGFDGHLQAWGELLCMTAGLPPLPPGVAMLNPNRSRRR